MRPPRILVVDDTREVRTLVRRVLETSGYEVIESEDGSGAITLFESLEGQIDLLVTDIKMPGMNGMELAAILTGRYPSICVLYISGQFDCEEAPPQISRKKAAFVSKPFLPQTLLEAVERMLIPSKGPGLAGPPPEEGAETA